MRQVNKRQVNKRKLKKNKIKYNLTSLVNIIVRSVISNSKVLNWHSHINSLYITMYQKYLNVNTAMVYFTLIIGYLSTKL